MSADNWAICPKCCQQKDAKIKDLKKKIGENYGKISVGQYETLINDLHNLTDKSVGHTLREDYDIGIWNENFDISYMASCSQCGFSHTYTLSEKVFP